MRYLLPLLLTLVAIASPANHADAAEINTAFAVIKYADNAQLKTFTKKVGGNSYGFSFGRKSSGTPEETARKKVNLLIGRVQEILDMRPSSLHFTIELHDSPQQVQAIYLKQYGRKVDFIAFYSPGTETVYFAANKMRRTVIAHEIAHAIIDRYFDKAPPVKIHELLAQFVEKQL